MPNTWSFSTLQQVKELNILYKVSLETMWTYILLQAVRARNIYKGALNIIWSTNSGEIMPDKEKTDFLTFFYFWQGMRSQFHNVFSNLIFKDSSDPPLLS